MNCCFFCQWRKHFGLWKLTMSSKRSNKKINLRQQIQTGILFDPRQNFVWRIWTILYQQFLHFRCSNAGIYPCSYSCQRLPCYKLSAPVSWGNECWGSVQAVQLAGWHQVWISLWFPLTCRICHWEIKAGGSCGSSISLTAGQSHLSKMYYRLIVGRKYSSTPKSEEMA